MHSFETVRQRLDALQAMQPCAPGAEQITEVLAQLREIEIDLRGEAAALEELRATAVPPWASPAPATDEYFEAAFTHAPIGMAVVGLDGMPLRVNRALCAMLGYAAEELLRKSVFEITHPDDLGFAVQSMRQLRAGEIDSYTYEKRYFHKQGHTVWALLSVCLVRDQGGEPRYAITHIVDIDERRRASDAVARERNFVNELLDAIPAAVTVLDETGRIVRLNRASERVIGFSSDDAQGRNLWTLFGDQTEADFAANSFRRQLAGEASPREARWIDRNGQRHVFAYSGAFLDGTNGQRYYVGTGIDITDRKRAEDALRESEQRFAHAFHDAPIGMALVAMDGRLILVNDALSDMVGYGRQELLEMTMADLMHGDDLSSHMESRERLMRGEIRSFVSERRFVHKSGRPAWAQISVSLVRSADNVPLYTVTQFNDISQRKQAEQALRLSEERFALAVAGAKDGIWDLDLSTGDL